MQVAIQPRRLGGEIMKFVKRVREDDTDTSHHDPECMPWQMNSQSMDEQEFSKSHRIAKFQPLENVK